MNKQPKVQLIQEKMTSAPQTSGNGMVYDDYTRLMSIQIHPNIFIYRPPNNHFQYHVKCEKISSSLDIQLLTKVKESIIQLKKNECIFFYQQRCNNQIYQVSCEIVAPSFINNCLNKNIYGIEIEQNAGHEELVFTNDQENNLEFHLSQYLNNYLLN